MSRKRSTFMCPKCKKTGSLVEQWVRSSRYATSEKTTLSKGKWVTEQQHQDGIVQTIKKFKTYSDKYSYYYVKHYNSKLGKQTKCYIGDIIKNEPDHSSSEWAELVSSITEIETSVVRLRKALKPIKNKISKYPLSPSDEKKVARLLKESNNSFNPFEEFYQIFYEIFDPYSSPQEWVRKANKFMQDFNIEKKEVLLEEELNNTKPEKIVRKTKRMMYLDPSLKGFALLAQTVRSVTHCEETESFITCA